MNNELDKALNNADMDTFDYDFLPSSIKGIAEVVGVKEAKNIAAMMAKRGKAAKIYMSVKSKNKCILQGVIADDSLEKLRRYFQGEIIDLHPCHNWQKAKTKQLIHKLKAKQFTAKDIAKKTGFHLATVYRELARRRGGD